MYFLGSGIYRRLRLRASDQQTDKLDAVRFLLSVAFQRFLGRNVQCGSGRPEKHLTVAQYGRNSTPDVTVPGGFCCMADDDDPNPKVTLDPDSADDLEDVDAPTPAHLPVGVAGGGPTLKKRRRVAQRQKGLAPMRPSSRAIERKTYSDRINRKIKGFRRPARTLSERLALEEKTMQRPHLPLYIRKAMIDEMVDMQQENEQTLISKPSHPQGGYISEDEEEVVITEMRKAADMGGNKVLSLQADSNVETSASDPWCTQDEADCTSANLEPISMQAGSHRLPSETVPRVPAKATTAMLTGMEKRPIVMQSPTMESSTD